MGWFDKKSPAETAETKSAIDINSPRALEMIRQGTAGVSGENALRVSAVYACVKVLSESISSMPLHLYSIEPNGSKTRKYNKVDRLVSIAPSDYQTSSEMWSYVVTSLALHGNAYLQIVRTGSGRPVELRVIPASSVTVHVDGHLVRYTVSVGPSGSQRTYEIKRQDILHFKGMTLDGYRGISPIQYNTSLIGGDRVAVDYNNRIYTNGATPRGVLEVDGALSDEAYENLRASWSAAHGGDNNGNRVAILESGVKFQGISMSPTDLNLLETRKYSRSEIASIFRVPPHMVGEMSSATYSNITDQSRSFYQYTLAPWLTAIEQRLNHTMAGPSECFRFDTDGLTRAPLTQEAPALQSLIQTGILSPNEARERMGLGPREGGDKFMEFNSGNPTQEEQGDSDEEDLPAESQES